MSTSTTTTTTATTTDGGQMEASPMTSRQSTQRSHSIHAHEMIRVACHRLQDHRNQGMDVQEEWVGVTAIVIILLMLLWVVVVVVDGGKTTIVHKQPRQQCCHHFQSKLSGERTRASYEEPRERGEPRRA